ncbi:MAG TPA: Omp28-related outer membrane protein [Candidatus Kapabacteria bacterium]
MVHTFKKSTSLLTLSLLAIATIAGSFLSPRSANAQYKRVYLEEFTGAWCGFCVRGAYAINNLYATYPGQVVVVSIHSDQNGNPANDMMDIPQGDSLVSGIGLPSAEVLQGFPDGWTARSIAPGSTTWNVDPSAWATGVAAKFGIGGTDGIVAGLLAEPVQATVTVDNISFDNNSQQVTATVSVTFAKAASGDLRLNLMVTEDSVTGSGSGWDQHNYYSATGSVGPSVPGNPLYNQAPSIAGWEHMHVFREAVGGVLGQPGIIPSSVTAGSTYSTTFTFTLPSNVEDPNHVHLIGMVHEYSATNASGNQVLDAEEVPLIGPAPKYLISSISVAPQTLYSIATSNGTTQVPMVITNKTALPGSDGKDSVTVSLSVDPSSLPTGWSATISPSTVSVKNGGTGTATLNVTAPEQSSFVNVSVLATPVAPGYIVATASGVAYLLSSNTRYGVYVPNGGAAENASVAGLPDSMKLHTAVMPLTSDILQNYDYTQFPVIILNNIPILDFNADLGLGVAPSVQMIEDELSLGNKVFINSDDALGYAFDGTDGYYSQYAGYTETYDVQSFYQQMGFNFQETVRNWNTNTNLLTPFPLTGSTGEPVGNNESAKDKGGFLSEIYSLDSVSTPAFYTGDASSLLGSLYVDSSTGAKLVYLGFGLSELTNQTQADTIFNRSINWLLSTQSAGVDLAATSSTAFTTYPNPFHGTTQISYTAAQGEENVTLAAYDLLGREIMPLPTHLSGTTYVASFDGSAFADGTYVILAHSSTGTKEVRVVNQQ